MNWILIDDGYYNSPAGGDGYVEVVTVGSSPSGTLRSAYLYAFTAVNTTSSNIWVQAFDVTSQPVNGTAPYFQLQVNANSQASISKPLPLYRWVFRNGIFIGASSTPGSYTASVGKVMMLNVYYTI